MNIAYLLKIIMLLTVLTPVAVINAQSSSSDQTEDSADASADFPFKSHYVEVFGQQMHYIDEGEGDPILFLHGNPTSSYLWRNIIPHVTEHGRAIAVDLIGMGKSAKPDIDYSFVEHVAYVEEFIRVMDLKNVTLVIHDWGSGIGFHYASRHEDNVKGIAFMEAIYEERPGMGALFEQFRTPDIGWELLVNQNLFVEQVLPGSVVRGLTEEEMTHYREPFLEPSSRKPVWKWPNELPLAGKPEGVVGMVKTYNAWLRESTLPKILFYAQPGALIGATQQEWFRLNVKNLEMVDIGPGRHFVQEDNPHGIGRELARWYQGL